MEETGLERLVQPLLTFPANSGTPRQDDVSPSATDRTLLVHSIGKPVPHLPNELWENIFSMLPNFSIKYGRLANPDWAAIGAGCLFRTLFLTASPQSLDGLIRIAGSIYAPLVKKITWSPLMLLPDCDDFEVWRLCYPNLLKNLEHAEMVRLHRTFCILYEDQEQNIQFSALATAMPKFVNCRNFTINDGLPDMESACEDLVLRLAVQKSPQFWQPSVWASSPRSAVNPTDSNHRTRGKSPNSVIVASYVRIVGALHNCTPLTTFTVLCKEETWVAVRSTFVPESVYGPRQERHRFRAFERHHGLLFERHHRSAFSNIRKVNMILERPTNRSRRVPSLEPHLPLMNLDYLELPELVDLTLKIVPVEYGPGHSDGDEQSEYPDPLRNNTVDASHLSEEHDGSTSNASSESDNSPAPIDENDPIKYYQSFVEETRLDPGTLAFPKLKRVVFGNVLINASSLYAWCWLQPHLPGSRLSITFTDVVILDELDLQNLRSAFSSLNVELCYDQRTTGYFPKSEWGPNLMFRDGRMGTWISKRFDMISSEHYEAKKRELKLMPSIAELPRSRNIALVSADRTIVPDSKSPCLHYVMGDSY